MILWCAYEFIYDVFVISKASPSFGWRKVLVAVESWLRFRYESVWAWKIGFNDVFILKAFSFACTEEFQDIHFERLSKATSWNLCGTGKTWARDDRGIIESGYLSEYHIFINGHSFFFSIFPNEEELIWNDLYPASEARENESFWTYC